MKIIILISTVTFVALSFIGIASYYNYNHILREKGLYAEEQHDIAENPVSGPVENAGSEIENDIQQNSTDPEQIQQQATEQKSPTHQDLSKQKAVKKQMVKKPVLASKRNPQRNIDFDDFSRAPMREPIEIEPLKPEADELSKNTKPEFNPDEKGNR